MKNINSSTQKVQQIPGKMNSARATLTHIIRERSNANDWKKKNPEGGKSETLTWDT